MYFMYHCAIDFNNTLSRYMEYIQSYLNKNYVPSGKNMGKAQQRKGADGERELAEKLKEYGFDVKRGGSLSFGDVPDIVGLPGVHIEVKRVERLNVGAAMQQAISDAARFNDGTPILFHRRNRKPWLVTMLLDDFIKLYRRRVNNGYMVDSEESGRCSDR